MICCWSAGAGCRGWSSSWWRLRSCPVDRAQNFKLFGLSQDDGMMSVVISRNDSPPGPHRSRHETMHRYLFQCRALPSRTLRLIADCSYLDWCMKLIDNGLNVSVTRTPWDSRSHGTDQHACARSRRRHSDDAGPS